MHVGNRPAPAEAALLVAEDPLVPLLAAAAWQHVLVHDYAHARLFYAYLSHLQPQAPNWMLGEALAELKCGRRAAAQRKLAALDAAACTDAQRLARARLLRLSGADR